MTQPSLSFPGLAQDLFGETPYALWVYDPATFKIVAANPAACRLYGYEAAQVEGLTIRDLYAKEEVPALAGWITDNQAASRLFWGPRRSRHVRRNGSTFTGEAVSVGVHWGTTAARLLLVTDTHGESSAVEAASRQVKLLEIIRILTDDLATEQDFTVMLRRVTERAATALGAERGSVWLWTRDHGALTPAVWVGHEEAVKAAIRYPGEGLVGTVATQGSGLLVDNFAQHPRTAADVIERWAVGSGVAAPILRNRELLGVIVLTRSEGRAPFSEADLQGLEPFASAAAVALDKAALVQRVAARDQTLDGVLRAAAVLLRGDLAVPETLDRIAQEASRIARTECARVVLREPSGEVRLAAHAGFPAERAALLCPPPTSLAGQTLVSGATLVSDDVQNDPRNLLDDQASALGLRGQLSVPIREGEQVSGCLVLNTQAIRRFGPEIDLLEGFAHFAGLALSLAHRFQREQARRDHLEALQEVIQDLCRKQVDLPRLMESAIDRVHRVVKADYGVVYTWNPKIGALTPCAWRGTGDWIATQRVESGVGIAGLAFARGQGVVEPTFRTSPRALPAELESTTLQTALAEPLIAREQPLGVLVLGRSHPVPFTIGEAKVVSGFAAQLALALGTARLVEDLEGELADRESAELEAQRRRQQLEAVSDIGDELAREIDSTALLTLLANRVLDLVDAQGSAVYVFDTEKQVLTAPKGAVEGLLSHCLLDTRTVGEGIVGKVAETRQGITTNEYHKSPYVLPNCLEPARLEACMAEPLLFRNRLLGVVEVARDTVGGPFTDETQETLRLFAKQAALALEHARLATELTECVTRLQGFQEESVQWSRMSTMSELISGITFSLNDQLSVILAQIEQLQTRITDQRVQEGLSILANAALEGRSIAKRLGGLNDRPGEGLQACSLQQIIAEAVNITKPRWKDKAELTGCRIQVDLKDLPATLPSVMGRPGDLQEVMVKLLLESVLGMPEGGTITITAQREAAFGDDPSEEVVVQVSDNGYGYPTWKLGVLFQSEFVDPARGQRRMGLGLLREAIERMDGRISVTSLPGSGKTFTIRLKATEAPAEQSKEAVLASPREHHSILLVDDNRDLLLTLSDLLESAGHRVLTADGGQQAIKVLENGPVDLMITDLGMPEMGGWELAEISKRRWPVMPVAVLTGWGPQGVAAKSRYERYIDKAIYKPVTLAVLQDVIARLCEAHVLAAA